MVDLRSRRNLPLTEDSQDINAAERLTPPATDLMDALRQQFAVYLPQAGPSGVVADEVAEQRGAWLVINFLQSIVDANKDRNA